MSEPLTPDRADKIRTMRREGFLWPDIACVVDLPVSVCIGVCERPE